VDPGNREVSATLPGRYSRIRPSTRISPRPTRWTLRRTRKIASEVAIKVVAGRVLQEAVRRDRVTMPVV
jgi:hypothetical protein